MSCFTGQKQTDTEDDDSTDLEDDDDADIDEKPQQPHGLDVADDSNSTEDEIIPVEVDFDEEADVSRKVLNSLISSSSKGASTSPSDDSTPPKRSHDAEPAPTLNKSSDVSADVPNTTKPGSSSKVEQTNPKPAEGEDDLRRTIFICNLPFDTNNEEVKQRFSSFGEVQSFFPVLHQVTKYGSV